jgi:hypothetical protein
METFITVIAIARGAKTFPLMECFLAIVTNEKSTIKASGAIVFIIWPDSRPPPIYFPTATVALRKHTIITVVTIESSVTRDSPIFADNILLTMTTLSKKHLKASRAVGKSIRPFVGFC